MRDLLPIICSGRARRADGSSSPAVRSRGAYDPVRPAFRGRPPPEGRPAYQSDSGRLFMQGAAPSLPMSFFEKRVPFESRAAPHPALRATFSPLCAGLSGESLRLWRVLDVIFQRRGATPADRRQPAIAPTSYVQDHIRLCGAMAGPPLRSGPPGDCDRPAWLLGGKQAIGAGRGQSSRSAAKRPAKAGLGLTPPRGDGSAV